MSGRNREIKIPFPSLMILNVIFSGDATINGLLRTLFLTMFIGLYLLNNLLHCFKF